MKIGGDIKIELKNKFKEQGIILPVHAPLVPSLAYVQITNMTRKIN